MTTTLPQPAPTALPCPVPRVRALRGCGRPGLGADTGAEPSSPAPPRPDHPGDADPGGPPEPGSPAPPLSRAITEPGPGGPPGRDVDAADTRRAITATLRTALEVLDGRRPATQLARVFEPCPLRYWRAEGARSRRAGPSRLLRVRLDRPRADAAEVAAVCAVDGRVRALAARFERRGRAWCCASVRLL